MPRILVADDEPNIREVISFALERAGFDTATARNGSEALQQFRRGPLDLIILDIGMPEMDGLEVCRQIRKTSEVPILFLYIDGNSRLWPKGARWARPGKLTIHVGPVHPPGPIEEVYAEYKKWVSGINAEAF